MFGVFEIQLVGREDGMCKGLQNLLFQIAVFFFWGGRGVSVKGIKKKEAKKKERRT